MKAQFITDEQLRNMFPGRSYCTDTQIRLIISELLAKRAVIRSILTTCRMEEERTINVHTETMRDYSG